MEANVEVVTKRKAHRRRKAGGKRNKKENKNSGHDRSMETMSDEPVEAAATSVTSVATGSFLGQPEPRREEGEPPRKHVKMMPEKERKHHQLLHHRKFVPHRTRRLLRPATVPKAPQNSTQFIIDDHENSAYFIDFERGFTSPGNREGVGWSPYFEQDFENVYRTARESVGIDWTHEVLVDKISSLEERVKTLEQQLSMCDPNVYMSQQLQHRIVCTTVPGDGNRHVQEFRVWCPMHGKKVRLRNPSSETSSEDCSSSSSQSQDDEEEEEGTVHQNGTETDSSDDGTTTGGEEQSERTVLMARSSVTSTSTVTVTTEASRIPVEDGQVSTKDNIEEEMVTAATVEDDGEEEKRADERTDDVQLTEDIASTEGP